jgi:CRP-like cAMP-binding protein
LQATNSYTMEAKEILKAHVAKMTSLTEEEFDYFFSFFRKQRFKKGQAVISVGSIVNCEYFVLSGCLKSFFINDDLKMFILQFALPTWWTSDYDALYNHARASICVDCITDAEVLCLSNADRERLCDDLHKVSHFFRWRTNNGYVAANKRLLSFMDNDAKYRYEELLQLNPELYNIVPKSLIAAYLGVSRETLSRLYQV